MELAALSSFPLWERKSQAPIDPGDLDHRNLFDFFPLIAVEQLLTDVSRSDCFAERLSWALNSRAHDSSEMGLKILRRNLNHMAETVLALLFHPRR